MLAPHHSWYELPYTYNTFVSDWLTGRQEYSHAYILHYIGISKEADFCERAYHAKKGGLTVL